MKHQIGRRQFNKLLASAGIATVSIPFVGGQALAANWLSFCNRDTVATLSDCLLEFPGYKFN